MTKTSELEKEILRLEKQYFIVWSLFNLAHAIIIIVFFVNELHLALFGGALGMIISLLILKIHKLDFKETKKQVEKLKLLDKEIERLEKERAIIRNSSIQGSEEITEKWFKKRGF